MSRDAAQLRCINQSLVMPRNVEVKARIADLADVQARAGALADQGPFELRHDDTFFACPNGRLKLRELAPDCGELIFYERPDVAGPKLSRYVIAPTSSPDAMRNALERAIGVVGRVRKRRRLYLVQNTRIHLDQVEALGSFLELEVGLSDSQSVADGEAVARRVLSVLGVPETDLIRGAYVDLLRVSDRRHR
jgi:predicted adenylyl cyclase CyaB